MTGAVSEGNGFDYRFLFEASEDGMLLATGEGTILEANPAACRLVRKRHEDLVAAGLEEVFDPSDPRLAPALGERRRAGRFEGELRLMRRDGTSLPAEVSIAGYQDETGEDKLGIVFRDASGRKQLEQTLRESEERFRVTCDLAGVGIAHMAPDGRFLRVNRKLCEMLGHDREELLQKMFQDITHPDDLGADLDIAQRMLAGEIATYSTEKCYVRKDLSQVWAVLTVSLVRESSGEPKYFVSFIEDMTGRKRGEQFLRLLTSREVEVLRLLAQGLTNREIAESMAFSVGTAKVNVERIIDKLDVSGRTQAAVRAFELGLLPPTRQ